MKMRRSTLLAGLAAAAGTRGAAFALPQGDADLIVRSETIHTVNDATPRAEAFAVRDGRFIYVGSREGVSRYRGRRTKVVDVGGATVLPGLIDAHLHLLHVGAALHEVELAHAPSYDEVVRRTVAFAATSPDQWVLGDGWDQNLWPGKAFPTHAALSAAFPQRPVVLTRVDGHAVLANAKAMELAHGSAPSAPTCGGRRRGGTTARRGAAAASCAMRRDSPRACSSTTQWIWWRARSRRRTTRNSCARPKRRWRSAIASV